LSVTPLSAVTASSSLHTLESLRIVANPQACRVGRAGLLLSAVDVPPAIVFLAPLFSSATVVVAIGLLIWRRGLLGHQWR
jgi:hypothetical protein